MNESAYDILDRYLRNNLSDDDYAKYSVSLEELAFDASRYRWLKEQKNLSLTTDYSLWKRDGIEFRASHCMASGGTQWGAYETLDQLIDAAMEST